jgi:hypothetical protein
MSLMGMFCFATHSSYLSQYTATDTNHSHAFPRNPVGTFPTAEQRFAVGMESAKETHNRWWAKRLVYESAGWPAALDKEDLRMRIREFERERFEAIDNARPDGSKEDEAENEFYKRAAGSHGV